MARRILLSPVIVVREEQPGRDDRESLLIQTITSLSRQPQASDPAIHLSSMRL
jgi:hypothetical protein